MYEHLRSYEAEIRTKRPKLMNVTQKSNFKTATSTLVTTRFTDKVIGGLLI